MPQWGDTDTLADAPKFETPVFTIDGSDSAVVSAVADTIVLPNHALETGVRVRYDASNVTPIVGLTDAEMYFIIRVDENTVKLATSLSNANAGTQVNITNVGDGTADTIQVAPADLFFVDQDEAAVASNRNKGIRTAGWNSVVEYTDQNGNTRRRIEPLVAMRKTASDAGDAGLTGTTGDEDATVADS